MKYFCGLYHFEHRVLVKLLTSCARRPEGQIPDQSNRQGITTSLGAVHKGRSHKIAKNYPPPCPRKMPKWLTPPPRTSTSEEPHLSAKSPNWTHTPPLPWLRTYFIDGPLILYILYTFYKNTRLIFAPNLRTN